MYTYKPFVDPKNNDLAEKAKERWQTEHNKVDKKELKSKQGSSKSIDRLLKPTVSPRWRDEQKKLRDTIELAGCTFRPAIS